MTRCPPKGRAWLAVQVGDAANSLMQLMEYSSVPWHVARREAGRTTRIAMRKITLFLTLSLVSTLPLLAANTRSQSYFSYDDGGTMVRQAEDGREIEARVNLPVFPGDEVTTGRRGRAEIRLADGNIIALDRSTSVRFRSILDSYDGDASQSVVELRFGHAAVVRTDDSRQLFRLDTTNASYAASDVAIYAVEGGERGAERVSVFDGTIEVRTPSRVTRVREGEEGRVDEQGLYETIRENRGAADDFERWFMRRAQRHTGATSRYLDRSIAYSDNDLEENGSWQYVSGFSSWAWRPRVAVGWRPYYDGYWQHSPGGLLVWVSNEPWGWVPYHYGRWGYDSSYGWVWLPGSGYAPAWVYWMYGPSYVGWAPMGWYDCYRPYYDWAYRPYSRVGYDFGYGFYGRVRVGDVDLRPWTFVEPNTLVSRRLDQATITTDVIRGRLQRGGSSPFATVSSAPARFSRSEIKDPTAAIDHIVRRGIGSGTGKDGSGSPTDMTPFFRRDPELSAVVRERIVRTRVTDPGRTLSGPSGAPSGVPSPGTPGTVEGRIGRGEPRTSDPGSVIDRRTGGTSRDGWRRDSAPSTSGEGTINRRDLNRGATEPSGNRDGGGRIGRDRTPAPSDPGGIRRDQTPAERAPARDREPGTWRDRIVRPSTPSQSEQQREERAGTAEATGDSWRGRTVGHRDRTEPEGSGDAPRDRGVAVPRRIIEGIVGPRIYPRDSGRESAPRDSQPRSINRDSAPRDSGRDSGARSTPREAPSRGEHSSPPPRTEHSAPPSEHHDSSSRSSEEHHIKRD